MFSPICASDIAAGMLSTILYILYSSLIFHRKTYAIYDELLTNNNSNNNNNNVVCLNSILQVDDNIKIIHEYLIWRNLGQVVLFDTIQRGNCMSVLKIGEYLLKNGIYTSFYVNQPEFDPKSFENVLHRLGVIHIITDVQRTILNKASDYKLFKEYYSWLLIHPESLSASLVKKIQGLKLEFGSDVVLITFPDNFFDLQPKKLIKTNIETGFEELHIDNTTSSSENEIYSMKQVYKIKTDDDTSLIIRNLGSWDVKSGFVDVREFQPLELRNDFHGFPIKIGLRNESDEGYYRMNGITQEDAEDDKYIEEFIELVVKSLNATSELVMYDNIGVQLHRNRWTDLLGGVVDGQVDIAIEVVPVTFNKQEYMSFSCKIFSISRNLYLLPAKESIIRNTYQKPFSLKLTISVFIVVFLMMATMAVVFRFNNRIHRKFELTDSIVWTIGVLSMQGSIYKSSTNSGRIITFCSLIFAMMIYNSYSAFITAVLSVRKSDIQSLQDVFHYRYDIGYVTESEDAYFLQEQTDELSRLYIAGYENKVNDIEDGLLMAATRKFAFFSAGAKGRKCLNSLNPREYRCMLQELVIPQTKEELAFPINPNSPYKKIIDLSIFRLQVSGALNNMKRLMYPSMPVCEPTSTYISAEIEDVNIPFYILVIGYILSLIIISIEILSKYLQQRKKIRKVFPRLQKNVRLYKNTGMHKNQFKIPR